MQGRFMERPERVFLLAIGLIFDRVPICLLLMAIASLITIIDRIIFTKKALEGNRKIHESSAV